MSLILIDTDVIIDFLRKKTKAKNYFEQCIAQKDKLGYSVITKAELYAGLRNGEEDAVVSLLNSMDEFPVDGEIAVQAGLYRNAFMKSHELLLPDALIAATAKCVGAKLVTCNIKDFPMKDIAVEAPY